MKFWASINKNRISLQQILLMLCFQCAFVDYPNVQLEKFHGTVMCVEMFVS